MFSRPKERKNTSRRIRNFAPVMPGVFTVGNMVAGFISILLSTSGKTGSAAYAILLGGIFDLVDGKVARLTKSTSEIGVQLDSFSDFLSFGVAPAVLLFSMNIYAAGKWDFLIPVLYLIAGAFRLARYNVTAEHDVKKDFRGLPIPLAAALVTSFVLFSEAVWGMVKYPQFFTPGLILLAWLMVSNVKYSAKINIGLGKKTKFRIVKVLLLAALIFGLAIKFRYVFFPAVALYVSLGFFRELYWVVTKISKEEA